MEPRLPAPVPGVADVALLRGPAADPAAPPDLLLETPHGATRAADYDRLAATLRGPFPPDLRDFFFVNTDVGSPELAAHVARLVVASDPRASVLLVRCLLPRTFVDCNRVIEPGDGARASAAGGVTPGIVRYVTDPADLARLVALHARYRDLVADAYEQVCGAGGLGVMVHSYAPREVDVPVDEHIVERLRDAYRPPRLGTWPLRAEADLITRTPDGVRLADERLVEAVLAALRGGGVAAEADATYALHPATLGHRFAARHPGRTLCLEVRRDLLVGAFVPFVELEADPGGVARVGTLLAAPLAGAIREARDRGVTRA